MIKGFKYFFKYLEPMWLGDDKKVSVKRALAIMFGVDIVRNIHHAVFKWDAGTSLEGLGYVLGIEAFLITALLSITTYQNVLMTKRNNISGDNAEDTVVRSPQGDAKTE